MTTASKSPNGDFQSITWTPATKKMCEWVSEGNARKIPEKSPLFPSFLLSFHRRVNEVAGENAVGTLFWLGNEEEQTRQRNAIIGLEKSSEFLTLIIDDRSRASRLNPKFALSQLGTEQRDTINSAAFLVLSKRWL